MVQRFPVGYVHSIVSPHKRAKQRCGFERTTAVRSKPHIFTVQAVINRRGRRVGHNPLLYRPRVISQVEPAIEEEVIEDPEPTILEEAPRRVEQEAVEATQKKRGRKKMSELEKKGGKLLRDAAKKTSSTQQTQAIPSAQSNKRKRANVVSSDDE